jgi:hypothetical protein
MARKQETWTFVTPLAYRRPHRPGRHVVLVASGLALSTVVAGLAVLGSIHPTPQSATAHAPGTTPPATTTSTSTPTTTFPWPSNGSSFAATYYGAPPRPTTSAAGGGYVAPALTPTDPPPPPPTQTSTDGNLTYTMTYDSGTVVVVYPSGAEGYDGGGGRHGGGHH